MMVQDILYVLSLNEIVLNVIVLIQVQEPGKQALRAIAYLKGEYALHINESLGRGYRNYSYHIQKSNRMVRRWTMRLIGQP